MRQDWQKVSELEIERRPDNPSYGGVWLLHLYKDTYAIATLQSDSNGNEWAWEVHRSGETLKLDSPLRVLGPLPMEGYEHIMV